MCCRWLLDSSKKAADLTAIPNWCCASLCIVFPLSNFVYFFWFWSFLSNISSIWASFFLSSLTLVHFFNSSIRFFGPGFDFSLSTVLFSLIYIRVCQVAPPTFGGDIISSQKVAITTLLFPLVNNCILWIMTTTPRSWITYFFVQLKIVGVCARYIVSSMSQYVLSSTSRFWFSLRYFGCWLSSIYFGFWLS